MTRNELNVLKANILGGFDEYIRSINDEDAYEEWAMLGVPDGADEEELMEIAEDSASFADIAKVFGNIVKAYIKSPEDEYTDDWRRGE